MSEALYESSLGLRLSLDESRKLDILQAELSAALGTRVSRSGVVRALIKQARVTTQQGLLEVENVRE